MSSVGIVTITGVGNYGNRLQNLALQEAIKGMGVDCVETIKSTQLPGTRRLLPRLGRKVRRAMGDKSPTGASHVLTSVQQSAIQTFVSAYIEESELDYSSEDATRELAERYDYFVVGSDQVWNPSFGLRQHLQFLEFAAPHQRVAYSASIGVPSIPRNQRERYRHGISTMAHVSVREDRAAELVSELSGREVPVTLDPTMLVAPSQWAAWAVTPPSLTGRGYCAQFFLGSPDAGAQETLHRHTSARDWEVVDLRAGGTDDLVALDPFGFIGAIRGASLLATDSFHAAVFAIIFEVPLLIQGRGAMNSRFSTLLSKSGITTASWRTKKEIDSALEVDWEHVRARLSAERTESIRYLASALSL